MDLRSDDVSKISSISEMKCSAQLCYWCALTRHDNLMTLEYCSMEKNQSSQVVGNGSIKFKIQGDPCSHLQRYMIYSFIVSGTYLSYFPTANDFIVVWNIYLWHVFATGSLLSHLRLSHEYLYSHRHAGQ